MNILALDNDPALAARFLCDQRLPHNMAHR